MTKSSRQTLLLTGASGRLGGRLNQFLQNRFTCVGTGLRNHPREYPAYRAADLADSDAALRLLDDIRPGVVIHCAALTDVDQCQDDPNAAFRANVQTTRHLADWILENGNSTRLIYVSTDQVYAGRGPHDEATAAPINTYGQTKLWGEDLARQVRNHLIVRTNFYGLAPKGRGGFADWLIEGLANARQMILFDDVLFNPLHVDDLCTAIDSLIDMDVTGKLNVGSHGDGLSKADFGLQLADALGFGTEFVTRGSVASANLRAPRPHDMRMRVSKYESILGEPLPGIGEGIDRLCRDVRSARLDATRKRSA